MAPLWVKTTNVLLFIIAVGCGASAPRPNVGTPSEVVESRVRFEIPDYELPISDVQRGYHTPLDHCVDGFCLRGLLDGETEFTETEHYLVAIFERFVVVWDGSHWEMKRFAEPMQSAHELSDGILVLCTHEELVVRWTDGTMLVSVPSDPDGLTGATTIFWSSEQRPESERRLNVLAGQQFFDGVRWHRLPCRGDRVVLMSERPWCAEVTADGASLIDGLDGRRVAVPLRAGSMRWRDDHGYGGRADTPLPAGSDNQACPRALYQHTRSPRGIQVNSQRQGRFFDIGTWTPNTVDVQLCEQAGDSFQCQTHILSPSLMVGFDGGPNLWSDFRGEQYPRTHFYTYQDELFLVITDRRTGARSTLFFDGAQFRSIPPHPEFGAYRVQVCGHSLCAVELQHQIDPSSQDQRHQFIAQRSLLSAHGWGDSRRDLISLAEYPADLRDGLHAHYLELGGREVLTLGTDPGSANRLDRSLARPIFAAVLFDIATGQVLSEESSLLVNGLEGAFWGSSELRFETRQWVRWPLPIQQSCRPFLGTNQHVRFLCDADSPQTYALVDQTLTPIDAEPPSDPTPDLYWSANRCEGMTNPDVLCVHHLGIERTVDGEGHSIATLPSPQSQGGLQPIESVRGAYRWRTTASFAMEGCDTVTLPGPDGVTRSIEVGVQFQCDEVTIELSPRHLLIPWPYWTGEGGATLVTDHAGTLRADPLQHESLSPGSEWLSCRSALGTYACLVSFDDQTAVFIIDVDELQLERPLLTLGQGGPRRLEFPDHLSINTDGSSFSIVPYRINARRSLGGNGFTASIITADDSFIYVQHVGRIASQSGFSCTNCGGISIPRTLPAAVVRNVGRDFSGSWAAQVFLAQVETRGSEAVRFQLGESGGYAFSSGGIDYFLLLHSSGNFLIDAAGHAFSVQDMDSQDAESSQSFSVSNGDLHLSSAGSYTLTALR